MANEKQLIDLNYALQQIELGELENGGVFASDSYHIKEFLSVLPTVDAVEVVHARWMVNNKEASCSACKFTTFEWAEWTFNYCPNCGARMDLED